MFTGCCYMLGTVGHFLLTVRAGEMTQGEKHMLGTCVDLSLTPQKLHKAWFGYMHGLNASTPTGRWEADKWESVEAKVLASLMYPSE